MAPISPASKVACHWIPDAGDHEFGHNVSCQVSHFRQTCRIEMFKTNMHMKAHKHKVLLSTPRLISYSRMHIPIQKRGFPLPPLHKYSIVCTCIPKESVWVQTTKSGKTSKTRLIRTSSAASLACSERGNDFPMFKCLNWPHSWLWATSDQ